MIINHPLLGPRDAANLSAWVMPARLTVPIQTQKMPTSFMNMPPR